MTNKRFWQLISLVLICGKISKDRVTAEQILFHDAPMAVRSGLVYWEEEVPLVTAISNDEASHKNEKRNILWNSKLHDIDPFLELPLKDRTHHTLPKLHPMRTDEWCIQLRSGRRLFGTNLMNLQFSDNGFVKLLNESSTIVEASIGRWKIIPSGIRWELPVKTNNNKTTTLHCHADLVLNSFGSQPHMVRGIMTRDRFQDSFLPRHWLRPVVATFTSTGTGKYLADTEC